MPSFALRSEMMMVTQLEVEVQYNCCIYAT